MAINVIGGSGSGSSAASGNVGGLNVVVAGWSTNGYYNLPSPRQTRYALSHQDGTNSRIVFDFGGAGNAVSTNYLIQDGSTLGGTLNSSNLGSAPTGVAVYSQWKRNATPAGPCYGVGYLNGTYFTGTNTGGIYSSPDLTTWTLRATPVSAVVRGFAYGNSVYCAVGTDASTVGLNATSADGITWTNHTTSNLFTDVTFGAGIFFATVNAGINGFRSTNGSTWTATTVGGVVNQIAHNGLAVGSGSLFVAVGSGGIFSSPDGITWTSRSNPTGVTLNGVAYGGGMWVAAGGSSGIASSPDGITWTSRTPSGIGAVNFNAVAYGAGRFIATANYITEASGYGGAWTSTNGMTWRPAGAISNNGFPLANSGSFKFGGGTFFGTAQGSYVASSADGLLGGGAGFSLLANAAPLIN